MLMPSRVASEVAVAGPSMRSIPNIFSRVGCANARSICGVGVIEVSSMRPTLKRQTTLCNHFFANMSSAVREGVLPCV